MNLVNLVNPTEVESSESAQVLVVNPVNLVNPPEVNPHRYL